MAHNLLFQLTEQLQETLPLLNDIDKKFYILSINQLNAMRKTITRKRDFFEKYFLNKTYSEVIEWIDNESKKW